MDLAGVRINADLDNLGGITERHGAADCGTPIFAAAVRLRKRREITAYGHRANVAQRFKRDFIERDSRILGAGAVNLTEAIDGIGL